MSGIAEFVTTAEAGSFVRAAERLGMSKSGVSVAVSRLEKRIGVKLLNRTTRSLSLTDEGADFHRVCRRLLSEYAEAEASLASRRGAPRGLLRIDAASVVAQYFLVPALPKFIAAYPDVRLDLRIGDRVIDLAREGVDCVFRIGEPADSSLIAKRLLDTKFVTVASREYLAEYGTPVAPAELARHNCIRFVFPTGRMQDWRFRSEGRDVVLPVDGNIVTNSAETLVQTALGGLGIVQTLHFLTASEIARGRLVPILTSQMAPGRPIYALHPGGRATTAKLRAFLDFANTVFRDAAREPRRSR